MTVDHEPVVQPDLPGPWKEKYMAHFGSWGTPVWLWFLVKLFTAPWEIVQALLRWLIGAAPAWSY